ncbi:Zn-dependent alcohol dehydrogenase [Cochlodiniinecator piscidefendens]|uniref:Zn-dependent alcohol dehydrogenase n=1 Tax=Cochlodiniinecator piscidefendens TaxID=2715756 RepID=UPI00140E10EC|nr:Zn-dependent alcohol dehydrogenase [Cochlodiniinecator piscidefendens]
MGKIRAAVCHDFGHPLSVEQIELRAPTFGEVEVTLEACAICHSDISFMDGGWGGSLPAVYGHEAAGRVSAVGTGVRGYEIGQPVLVTLIRACRDCPPCASGSPVSCETPPIMDNVLTSHKGTPINQAMECGAFADKVVVDPSQLAPIPESLPMDVACLLSCGVITGVGAAVNAANVRPGQTVVVIGAGGVGLNAIQGARIAGAAKIIAVDMVPEKLDTAKEFGATHGILASDDKPWKQVAQITDRRMADAVLVSVGAVRAYNEAPRYLAPKGKVVMVGMPHSGDIAKYEPVIFAALGQGMIGTKMGDTVLRRDIPWLVDMYEQGRLKLDELISGRWTLDQINEAIEDTRSGAARRNVILFK